ncbi:hypothetical protein PLICRDRAFT_41465 [Plicaturopsis crispa FD-325 SS-3]|nr:hypothetical protein PLICRDRAFT_41465 [Plicaturopsis crispa FD-325 SS-3]
MPVCVCPLSFVEEISSNSVQLLGALTFVGCQSVQGSSCSQPRRRRQASRHRASNILRGPSRIQTTWSDLTTELTTADDLITTLTIMPRHYPEQRLDTPPPQSQLRRPWSPDPYDPFPSASAQVLSAGEPWHRTREPSDVSVDALDLADYARTIQPNSRTERYAQPRPDMHNRQDLYRAQARASRDSLQPPSLVSGGTISSHSHSYPHTYTSSTRNPARRPFSLPPPPLAHRPLADDTRSPPLDDPEIDISQFPAWSRNWYDSRGKQPHLPGSPYDYSPPASYDFFPPVHGVGSTTKISPFDPTYNANSIAHEHYDGYDPYAASNPSTRDLLPWSSSPPTSSTPLAPDIKEERMRMLENEFGPKSKSERHNNGDNEGGPVVGSIDENGHLITHGPKKRTALRAVQILLAAGAAVSSLYSALVLKPKSKPPPQSTPAAFVLYIFSVLTTLVLLYLFLIRPCTSGRSRSKAKNGMGMGMPGMMVLPINGGPGKKKKRKGKKGGPGRDSGDVQVNLIVDPTMFHPQRRDENDESDHGEDMPGTYSNDGPPRAPKRRGVMAGLALESQWRQARSALRKLSVFDAVAGLLWGAVFVFILIGKRCPSGQYDGWCTGYNVASAAACLLSVAFFLHLFFDVKDLHTSRVSPRTR